MRRLAHVLANLDSRLPTTSAIKPVVCVCVCVCLSAGAERRVLRSAKEEYPMCTSQLPGIYITHIVQLYA